MDERDDDRRLNPYAPPATLAEAFQPLAVGIWSVGVWRAGHLLVMHKDAPLPLFCVHTGQPAVGAHRWNVIWKSEGDLLSRNKELYLPVCRHHLVRFAWHRRWFQIGLALMGVAVVASLVFLTQPLPSAIAMGCFSLIGLVGTGLWLAGWILTGAPLGIEQTRGDYLWLSGVHPDFLQRLPAWPFE